jgi:transglutaminase-like putative cysteine protease
MTETECVDDQTSMSAGTGLKYHVRHVTEVRYDALVKLARFNLRLKPAEWTGQTLLEHRLEIAPRPKSIVTQSGPFIVEVARLMLDKPTASLVVASEFTVEVDRPVIAIDADAPSLAQVRAEAQEARSLSAHDPSAYIFASPIAAMAPEIADWAAPILASGSSVVAAAAKLMHAIHRQFAYDSKATNVNTPPLQAFRKRRGVCQDFAHIMIIALRHFGVPAAYVSGYLRTIPPPGKAKLVGADATHAWVNVWCGAQLGWIGFDPTNAILATNDHIFTAMGRDFADVSPVDGVFIGGAGQRMKVSVEVTPLG